MSINPFYNSTTPNNTATNHHSTSPVIKMQFSNLIMTLASVALATAAPTAGNQSTVADVPVMGEWRPTFTTTDQPQTGCNVEARMSSLLSFRE